MRILIRGGRVIDPASGRDGIGDVFLADGKIAEAKGTRIAPSTRRDWSSHRGWSTFRHGCANRATNTRRPCSPKWKLR
jgi:hypothetical protein